MVNTVATAPGDSATIAAEAPTENQKLLDFVTEIAQLTTPDRIHWVDGSEQ